MEKKKYRVHCKLAWRMFRAGDMKTKQLARLADTSPRSIRALRRNEAKAVSFDLIVRLCDVLECSIADLFELEEVL